MRPRLHPERGPRRAGRADRRLQLVRLRRPQRVDRRPPLGGVGTALSPADAARVYDRIGRFQDWQLYERPAVAELVAHAGFERARSVLELGCGTGKLAERLLAERLPAEARYLGLDVSPRMVALASARVSRWAGRAEVRLVDGSLPLPSADGAHDRFVSLWVLDLMDDAATSALLDEAARVLAPGGLLCLAGLTRGQDGLSRLVSSGWEALWRVRPGLVGGCRPRALELPEAFAVRRRRVVVSWAVASEVVVAERR